MGATAAVAPAGAGAGWHDKAPSTTSDEARRRGSGTLHRREPTPRPSTTPWKATTAGAGCVTWPREPNGKLQALSDETLQRNLETFAEVLGQAARRRLLSRVEDPDKAPHIGVGRTPPGMKTKRELRLAHNPTNFSPRPTASPGRGIGLGLTAALALVLSACGDDTDTPVPTGGGGGGGEGGATTTSGGSDPGGNGGGGAAPFELTLDWYVCPSSSPGQTAECAHTEVPLDWDNPSGRTIDYFVKRIPAPQQPARGQAWLLQGGPGFPGSTIEGLASLIQTEHPDLDVWVPDHRGTGYSNELVCASLDPIPSTSQPIDPQAAATEAQACVDALTAEWGSDLKFFSATDAARDVGEIIAATQAPSDDVFVLGVSYGTRWAHRYLQQFPKQAMGVILDSTVAEPGDFLQFDKNIDTAAHRLFDGCSTDPFCSSKLGSDAWGFMGALMTKLDAGHCPTSANLNKDDYRALMAWVFQLGFLDRSLLPAVAYRIDRCDATDQDVLLMLRQISIDNAAGSLPYISSALHFNVVAGELAPRPTPTAAEIVAVDAPLRVATEQIRGYREVVALWPGYEHDTYFDTYATTSTPLLFLQSPLDGQTPIEGAQELASHYTEPHQSFVTISRGGHGLITESPTPTGPCGMKIIAQFMADPKAALDTSCSADVLPLDFEHPGENFGPGTLSVWENGAAVFAATPANRIDLRPAIRERASRSFGGFR